MTLEVWTSNPLSPKLIDQVLVSEAHLLDGSSGSANSFSRELTLIPRSLTSPFVICTMPFSHLNGTMKMKELNWKQSAGGERGHACCTFAPAKHRCHAEEPGNLVNQTYEPQICICEPQMPPQMTCKDTVYA
ncbi:hypothetical protein HAX54_048663 [Datura stramonium]|uniref:Uncharacterized protein n=1 Tax=Datura stramonium TaxID=4076 RepID=A0ABS8SU52_DATST|nr:hypothetical protein [Datura stramonium]